MKTKLFIAVLVAIAFGWAGRAFYTNRNSWNNFPPTQEQSQCRVNTGSLRAQLLLLDSEKLKVQPKEFNVSGVFSEGAKVMEYDLAGDYKIIEVYSFVTLARFFTQYYLHNDQVIYVTSVTDEWDLKKLYGEHGEKTAAEGEYVVGTSTTEGYAVKDGQLCQYYAQTPRKASPATTESSPQKDLQGLLELFSKFTGVIHSSSK